MNMRHVLSYAVMAGLASSVSAQIGGGIGDEADEMYHWFRQPWTQPAAAHESRVLSCASPVPLNEVAYDDFGFSQSGTAIRLRWWGVLQSADQLNRPYYVAIYANADCQPGDLLYETCVVPQSQFVGVDCLGEQVRVFRAPINFPVTAGERYWLQISENDAASANVGQPDFAWSGRQPVRGCNALQAHNGEFKEIIDPCNLMEDDLSFSILLQLP